jgi:hypothetical protein
MTSASGGMRVLPNLALRWCSRSPPLPLFGSSLVLTICPLSAGVYVEAFYRTRSFVSASLGAGMTTLAC